MFWLIVCEVLKKRLGFLLTRRDPITACCEEAELLQENNPRLCSTDWMWSTGPAAELNTLHMGAASHGAKHKNTIQTKGRLMAGLIATQRFVLIFVFVFSRSIFYTQYRSFLTTTDVHVSSSWDSDSLFLYNNTAAIYAVIKLPLS